MNDRWITTDTATKLLNVSRQRVSQLIHGGKLKAKRMGHFWLVDRKSVEARLKTAS